MMKGWIMETRNFEIFEHESLALHVTKLAGVASSFQPKKFSRLGSFKEEHHSLDGPKPAKHKAFLYIQFITYLPKWLN
jgi:hypothetical protein